MYFLGIDIGSSSIKLSVLDGDKEAIIARVSLPDDEMDIHAPEFGWAEQDPDTWWAYVKEGLALLKEKRHVDLKKIKAIGIAYQMHGLVLTDENLSPVRPSIIWCDSRAAEIGNELFDTIGHEKSRKQLLGSPGNFTASKLKWVQRHEPENYAKSSKMMLPGDYIAARLSRLPQTTPSGLSEAALWDFSRNKLALPILDQMELSSDLIPEIVPTFGHQARVHPEVASELGLSPDTLITYRAGDQPNNALSLNVFNPGEIATTAGTSAVVYAISDQNISDPQGRINTFLHVSDTEHEKRNGMLGIINGAGILYQWLRKLMSHSQEQLISYEQLNMEAAKVAPGSDGLRFYPFGNGVERIFNNRQVNSGIENLNFNIHQTPHLVRAACEGIVYAMNYGFDVIKSLGTSGEIVKAGRANLFLNPVFREIFCNTTQATLELYNTSGAEGAARGAAYGYGFYANLSEAMDQLEILERVEPSPQLSQEYQELFQEWKNNIKIKN